MAEMLVKLLPAHRLNWLVLPLNDPSSIESCISR